ncbi:MAG: ribonuclease [Fluviicola sp. XM-24bin1]|nr:MAG: ribonuclease [Fluviicola sp. XM-24bin1]
MKFTLFIYTLITISTCLGQAGDYYQGCEGLSGEELKAKLHSIIRNHKMYAYSTPGRDSTDCWDILKETDRDPENPNNVILVYSGMSTDAEQEYNNMKGWEKEHTWSASHGGFNRYADTAGTDVHHLKPVHYYFNRANGKYARDFDDCETPVVFKEEEYGCFMDGDAFEPRDEVKGDIARMIFYMAVRYESAPYDLEIVDEVGSSDHPNNLPFYGKLSTLLEWHRLDPVDEFEMNRNEVIYSYQGNRNPFIDNPEFVALIWQ